MAITTKKLKEIILSNSLQDYAKDYGINLDELKAEYWERMNKTKIDYSQAEITIFYPPVFLPELPKE